MLCRVEYYIFKPSVLPCRLQDLMLCGNAVCGHVRAAVEWPYQGFLAAAVGHVVLYLTPVDRNGAAASRITVFWCR